ncbi:MAG: CRISPR-associated endonuclease Cas2 [Sulfurovum sp.]|nr:CRISPR-associated endonuclease Cas2 [Sulfurovum sp.]
MIYQQRLKNKKVHTPFRKNPLENGFFMLQYSVYCCICKGVQLSKNIVNIYESNTF